MRSVALLLVVLAPAFACDGSNRALPASPDASGTSGGAGGAATGGNQAAGGTGSGGSAGSGGASAGGAGGIQVGDAGASCKECPVVQPDCCDGRCLKLANDPFNCGKCGNRCPAERPLCEGGECGKAPCSSTSCGGALCCGRGCCQPDQLCCSIEGPISSAIVCHTPTAAEPTCPPGCAPLCVSDRNLKRAITPVDPHEVLARLGGLPISTWSYKSDPESVRHMGPMAQDFRAAFGLGDTDRAYHAIDAHGVALAAIQALGRLTDEQRRRIETLERENRALERRLRLLERGRRAPPTSP
jgi:hypothetical protein